MTDRPDPAPNLRIDRPDDHVLRILIDRPAKLNAVDFAVRDDMIRVLTDELENPRTRAIVFGGVGGNLSAGGDLPSMTGLTEQQAEDRLRHIHRLCRLVGEAPIPIVTAAEGIAAGASVGLAMLGDWIVAGPSTAILVPFLKLGLVPDWGMLRSLPLRVGLPQARRIIFDSARIEGVEAERIGLVDRLVDNDRVMPEAVARAATLARLPRQAVALLKQRWSGGPRSFEQDLEQEQADQVRLLQSADFREGHAAFAEKRRPDFIRTSARRPISAADASRRTP